MMNVFIKRWVCKRTVLLSTAMLLALGAVAGCSDGRPDRVPVSGKVLIDGEPLKFGSVEFVPEGGRMSSGVLDANGHFTLACFTLNDGALIGKHQIQIRAEELINDVTTRIHAPKRYGSLGASGLSEEITVPTDSIVINLTWKGSGHDKPYMETDSFARDAESPRFRKANTSKQ
jgi:hypothetical protein